jgi:uncharacterized protein YbcI
MSDSLEPNTADEHEPTEDGGDRGQLLSRISNAMVHLYKEDFGRGPTKTKTYFAGPDIVVCVLRDTFTRAEQRMAEEGEHQRLRDTRLFFQHATEKEFRKVVEEATGRRVTSFVSGIDTREDVAIEFFTLEPDGAESAEAAET